ncbi:hypothetical protein TNCV_4527111 [Trichonephila clavipes]|nr:hypothetical protein TNCV_4527111 [Trichonephila clavipes]
MASLGHQSLPPTDLGRVDEEMASPSGGYHRVSKSGKEIWNWEIVNPDDPDQDNGTKLLNYCIANGS